MNFIKDDDDFWPSDGEMITIDGRDRALLLMNRCFISFVGSS